MLWSQEAHFKYRWELFKKLRQSIEDNEGGLQKFAQGERREVSMRRTGKDPAAQSIVAQ